MATAAAKDLELPAFCFLKISIAGVVHKQPIVIQLNDSKECPKTCQNFVALCTSPETTSRQSSCPSYRGCEFHRIIDDFMVQGGDFERFDGTGGYSPIHGGVGGKFADENLKGKHDQAGIVSMANAGKNTNKSQFFITVKAAPHLDGKHVVFGKVITGMETLKEMLSVEREGDRPVPMQRVVICDCGVGKGNEKSGSTDREHESSKNERRRKKKRKKHSRKYDDSSSSNDDSSSSSEEEERHRKKRKRRSKDSRSDDESSSYERRKKKKKKHHRKEHKRKKSKDRDRSHR